MKKMSELITLCRIDACAIMCSQYESQPKVWPSPIGVQQVLFKKNMVNQESFFSQRTIKEVKQLNKHSKDNRVKKMTQFMFNNICGKWVVHGLNFWDLNDLSLLLDEKMSNIDKRMDAFAITPLNAQGASSSSSSFMVALPLMTMISGWIYELTNLHLNLAS
ncbi:hypothetical protein ES332_D03G126700v1 [Gossypium tomentosum]|uniref:MADS-box domain-containing protein n=1 Tax=Gossypium tomentosum TaxID=34277 RepID=A0A5D2LMM9_GOSTO|nr:hypothetical protein ES332_D03G126700v1 [Gossypium tomentosum]